MKKLQRKGLAIKATCGRALGIKVSPYRPLLHSSAMLSPQDTDESHFLRSHFSDCSQTLLLCRSPPLMNCQREMISLVITTHDNGLVCVSLCLGKFKTSTSFYKDAFENEGNEILLQLFL